MAYITGPDLAARYDIRDLGEYVSDDGRQVSEVDLPTNPVLLAILDDASGAVDAALQAAGLYSADDLAGLTGSALSHLKRITSDIAMAYLYARRPALDPEKYQQLMEIAEAHLERLRKGQNSFNLTPQVQAGQPSVDGPTTADFRNLNLIRDRTRNFYPYRQTPYNR